MSHDKRYNISRQQSCSLTVSPLRSLAISFLDSTNLGAVYEVCILVYCCSQNTSFWADKREGEAATAAVWCPFFMTCINCVGLVQVWLDKYDFNCYVSNDINASYPLPMAPTALLLLANTHPSSLQRLWYPRYITPLYPDNISVLYLDELKGGDQHILNAFVDSYHNGWGVALLSPLASSPCLYLSGCCVQGMMTKVSFCDKINHDNYHPHQPEVSQPNLMLSKV